MYPSSAFKLIRSVWSIVAFKIDTFAKSFLLVYIEPGREVFRKTLYAQVKRKIAIEAACPKRFGLTILQLNLVCIGT